MMPSNDTSTTHGHLGRDDHVNTDTSSPSVQLRQLTLCHEAAITLNNFIITKLLLRDRNVRAASITFRDVIYLIKKCIIPPSATGITDVTYPTITADEIHEVVHQAYQRAVVVTPLPDPSSLSLRETTNGSFQSENDIIADHRVHIQVISNCLPCSNVVTSRYNTTMTTAPTSPLVPAQAPASTTANVSTIPATSSHSTESASSTVSSGASTTNINSVAPTSMGVLPSSNDTTSRDVHLPSASVEMMAVASTAESTNQNDNHDDTPTTMSVYPMTIDDFQACSIHHGLMDIDGDENNNYNRVRMIEYQQFVEYHAAIILYNFGIIHQCLGMTEDDPAMMDSDEAQNHAGTVNGTNSGVVSLSTTRAGPDSLPMAIDTSGNRNMAVDHQPYDDQNDDVSSERLLASYKILTNTLSWIHELVRPIMDDIMNDGNDDASHTNMEISSSIATSSPDDQYYMNKYLQVMVLINYHVLDIIDTLQFPDGPYQYHCTMMNEILNFISYLEIFYPMTSSNINDHSNSIGHGNTRGSASPAA